MNTNKTKINAALNELYASNSEIIEELESRRYDGKIVPKWVINSIAFASGCLAVAPLVQHLISSIAGLKGGALMAVLKNMGGFLESSLSLIGVTMAPSLAGLLTVVVLAIVLYYGGKWIAKMVFELFEKYRDYRFEVMYGDAVKNMKLVSEQVSIAVKSEQVSKVQLAYISAATLRLYVSMGVMCESKYSAEKYVFFEDSIADSAKELFERAMAAVEGLLSVIPLAEIETNADRDTLVADALKRIASRPHVDLIVKERGH